MVSTLSINIGNLLLSLSDAIEIANPSIALHQIKTAYIALRIAESINLQKTKMENIFIAALFHDIGAISVEDKIRLHNFEENKTDTHCILTDAFFSLNPLFKASTKIVRYHHRAWRDWDEPISSPGVLESQIINCADLLERLISRNQFILHQVDMLILKMN